MACVLAATVCGKSLLIASWLWRTVCNVFVLLCVCVMRVRPQAGYYSSGEASTSVQRCLQPATDRCLGWNSTQQSSSCGPGYTGPTTGCLTCAEQYYPELGMCLPCPPPGRDKLIPIFSFMGVLVALFGFVVCLAMAVAYKKTGSVRWTSAVFRGRDFAVWVMVTWQTILQVSKRSVNAPPLVRSVYSALAVLELDSSVVVHPVCYSSYPFMMQLMQFTGSLVTTSVVLVLFSVGRGDSLQKRASASAMGKLVGAVPTLRRLGMAALMLLYPMVCNGVLNMLYCRANENGEYALAYNSSFRCYVGPHLPVAALAWLVLVVHVIGFPVMTFLYLRRHVKHSAVMPPAWQSTWQTFTAQDFQPEMYWFVHVNLVSVFILSMLLVFFPTTPSTAIWKEVCVLLITSAVIGVTMTLVLRLKPYNARRLWKVPVKCIALGVTFASAVANLVCALYTKGSVDAIGADLASFAVLLMLCVLAVAFFVKFSQAVWESSTRVDMLSVGKSAAGVGTLGSVDKDSDGQSRAERVRRFGDPKSDHSGNNNNNDNPMFALTNPFRSGAELAEKAAPRDGVVLKQLQRGPDSRSNPSMFAKLTPLAGPGPAVAASSRNVNAAQYVLAVSPLSCNA